MRFAATLLCFAFACSGFAQPFKGFKSINGTKLYFNIMGSGEPLVFIHGGPGLSHDYLLPHIKPLSKDYKLVLFDLRGNGRSATPSPDSLALSFFVNDIEEIRKMLGVETLQLFGHSWGSLLAVAYAANFPNRIKKLVLCNPVPLDKSYDQEMMNTQLSRATGSDSTDRALIRGSKPFRDGKVEAYEKLMMLSFRNSFFKEDNFRKLKVQLQPGYLASSRALFTELSKDLMIYDFYPKLRDFSFPVLILHGEYDAIPMDAVERMVQQLPDGKLEVFGKSGHFLFIEEARKFAREVRGFLRE